MKKFVSLLFAASLLLCCFWGKAEAYTEAYSPTQRISIPVTLLFDQADGTTKKVILDFSAYALKWDFQLSRNSETGDYNGFILDLDHFFSFTPVTTEASIVPFAHLVETNITTLKMPDKKITCFLDGSCEVQFSGGSYEVTYTSAFHFGVSGELIDVEQSTLKRTFDFSEQFAAHKP